jgi:hypothetical protein
MITQGVINTVDKIEALSTVLELAEVNILPDFLIDVATERDKQKEACAKIRLYLSILKKEKHNGTRNNKNSR